jgi:hypothetical protein
MPFRQPVSSGELISGTAKKLARERLCCPHKKMLLKGA